MAWDDDLLPEQRAAAGHFGQHARLLAGPGTGKTRCLTRRACFLVEEAHVIPESILALTFTRAAAHELRTRVRSELGGDAIPRISTLHSFALRQLLRNARRLQALPQPLRIADDWEERNIILEDVKTLLALARIEDARELLNQLSADWQSLTAEDDNWGARFPNPRFLGAWQEHRRVYGYTLRAELVYQLKRALEQHGDFEIEGCPAHLLVDEYQDLNRCDLAVVRAIAEREAEIFVAGDDDQSIYGFRKAHPEGIRRFSRDYNPTTELTLEVCKRCEKEILDLGLFVARQDYRRLEKPLRHDDGREGGQVAILRFLDQFHEANGVAGLCRVLIDQRRFRPHEILILLRTDRNRAFSSILRDSLDRAAVPVSIVTAEASPIDDSPGRIALAVLRLINNQQDHLAWRTLLELRRNGVGPAAIGAMYGLARGNGIAFSAALASIEADPIVIAPRHGARIGREAAAIRALVAALNPPAGEPALGSIRRVVTSTVPEGQEREAVLAELSEVITASESRTISDALRAIETSSVDVEQEIEQDKVNILTMHKAKGLTAKAVIVMAGEDEYLPGRAQGEGVDDERRLLYVSLTRAMYCLFVTYCNRRTGQQRHTGRTSGNAQRSLTRFLRDGPIAPVDGPQYIADLRERAP